MAPKIELIARGIVIRENHLLVCQAVKAGYFYLPGGHIEFGEPAAVALAREIKEETGLSSIVGHFLMASEHAFPGKKRFHHELNVLFHVEQLGGTDRRIEVASQEDDLAFEWIDLAAIQGIDLRPHELKAWITTGGTDTLNWISGMTSIPES